MEKVYQYYFHSPFGWLCISSNEKTILSVEFVAQKERHEISDKQLPVVLKLAVKQLEEYFIGERLKFDLPLSLEGTPFQKSVWQSLQEIPFGETYSYQELAKKIGNEKSCRAVGNANNKNPIPIIIPCHRVIGKSGRPRGFAPGVSYQEWLLNHENHFKNSRQ